MKSNLNTSLTRLKNLECYQILSFEENGRCSFIHTIFTLGTEPYQLYSFKFESIKDDKITDIGILKQGCLWTWELPVNLYGNILYLKIFEKQKGNIKK